MTAKAKHLAQSHTAIAAILAVAFVVAGLLVSPLAGADPQKPVLAKSSLVWADGLNHFIITPSSILPKKVSISKLDELPEGAVLTRSPEGKPLALLKDGRLVPIGEEIETTEDPKVSLVGGADGRAASEALAKTAMAWPDVKDAKPLGGGLISIATSLKKDAFEGRAEVSRVDEDILLESANVSQGTPNDPLYGSEWMLTNTGASSQAGGYSGKVDADTDAPQAWARSTGAGVIVADIDSGVDVDHPDLSPNIWRNSADGCGDNVDNDRNGYVDDCVGWDSAANDNNPRPDSTTNVGSHGTHVAGIIGAAGDNNKGLVGMAPSARIMALKIAYGENLSTSAIVSATMYAVDNGAKIINGSWGTPPGTYRGSAWPMEQAMAYAQQRNVLYVVAAGNSGANIDDQNSWPASFSRYYNNVLTVGASTNSDTLASFSNYGSSVDVVAPGWFINSTMPNGGYGMMSGTSMASPCTAGAAALVLATNPSLSAAQLKQRMRDTVDDVPALRGRSATNRINAAVAVGAGTDAFNVTYSGFDHIGLAGEPFTVNAQITANDNTVSSQTSKLYATFITREGDGIYAAGDMGVGLMVNNDLDNQRGVVTDENGVAIIDGINLTSPVDVGLHLSMPAGDYAMMLQPADSNGAVVGNGSVVFFTVSPQPDNSAGSGGGGGSGDGGTWTPPPSSGGGSSGGSSGGGTWAPPGGGGGSWSPPSNGGGTWTPPSGGGGGTWTPPPGSGSSSGGGSWSPPSSGGSGSWSPPSSGGSSSGGGSWSPPSSGGDGSVVVSPPSGGGSSGGGGSWSPPLSGGESQPAPEPQPVRANGWELTSVSPRTGDVGGGTMLVLRGLFLNPNSASVSVGGVNARILYAGAGTILAYTPAHTAGTVDVTVSAPNAILNMQQVFTYTSATSGGGSSGGGSSIGGGTPPPSGGGSFTPPPSGGGSTGGGGGGWTPPSNPGGGGGGSSGGGGNTGGSTGGSTDGGSAPSGPSEITRGNLRLAPIQGNSSLVAIASNAWPGAVCKSTCRGTTVR